MDRSNLTAIRWLAPSGLAERAQMLLKFAQPASSGDVADPYGGTRDDYERALNLIEVACAGLLQNLQMSHGLVGSTKPHLSLA
jgi:protein-tyrosine phosphatase